MSGVRKGMHSSAVCEAHGAMFDHFCRSKLAETVGWNRPCKRLRGKNRRKNDGRVIQVRPRSRSKTVVTMEEPSRCAGWLEENMVD